MKISEKEGVVGFVKKLDDNREYAAAFDTLAETGDIIDFTFKGYASDFKKKEQTAQEIIDDC